MIVTLDKNVNKGDKRIDDNNNPKFYKMFEFEHKFPGASDITIEFYDYDPITRDDLIAKTSIDIERRFFDRKWR